MIDGELQVDAAIVPEIAEAKAAASPLQGKSQFLFFRILMSVISHISTQRLAKADAYGPSLRESQSPE